MSTIGAYRRDGDPSVVFAYARPDAPGGRFFATRIGGVWRAHEPTIGELEDGYTRIRDAGEVASLLAMARATLDPEEAVDRHSLRALRDLAAERRKRS
jgi:hypothetical protein